MLSLLTLRLEIVLVRQTLVHKLLKKSSFFILYYI